MSPLKIIVLLVVAAVSLYIGFRLEPVVMAVMYDPQWYEYTFPLPYRHALYRYYFFIVGVIVSTATLLTSRLLRWPDFSAIFVISVASLFFRPMIDLLIYGKGLSIYSVIEILFFQAPYFVGMFAVFGMLTVFKLVISPFLTGKNN